MAFTSNIFIIGLLPWFILLIFITRNKDKLKRIWILMANTLFYIWGGFGAFLFVIIYSVCIWLFSNIVIQVKKRYFLCIFAIISIAPLLAIKYTDFAINNINNIFNCSIPYWNIIVPLGISFFTFEGISLICDSYSCKIDRKISLIDVYLYITFFPTVTSGPIIRFQDFNIGIQNKIDTDVYSSAIERIAVGLCKKMLIADKIAILADYYFDGVALGNTYSSIGLWIGSIAYTLQLYFDFSGYSDMAIGIGKLLGFNICENFDKPYQAASISDFWKRWHISLSQWFRDYVYIPLGGNRCKSYRHITNLFIVWCLTGIWHGADWSFVIWGIGYFVLLVIEKYVPCMRKIGTRWFGHIYALFFINLLWIPFRADNLRIAGKFIAGMFGVGSNGLIEKKAVAFIPYIIISIVLCMPYEKIENRLLGKSWYKNLKRFMLVVLVILAICAVVSASYAPYIYGNF